MKVPQTQLGKIMGLALLAGLALIRLPAESGSQQMPLNDRTLGRAERLRCDLQRPLLAVRPSEAKLRELARIPDPSSFDLWREVLMQPGRYPAPVRREAVRSLRDYRGASRESVSRLLIEALAHEKVREVQSEIQASLHGRAGAMPVYFARRSAAAFGRVKLLE